MELASTVTLTRTGIKATVSYFAQMRFVFLLSIQSERCKHTDDKHDTTQLDVFASCVLLGISSRLRKQ